MYGILVSSLLRNLLRMNSFVSLFLTNFQLSEDLQFLGRNALLKISPATCFHVEETKHQTQRLKEVTDEEKRGAMKCHNLVA